MGCTIHVKCVNLNDGGVLKHVHYKLFSQSFLPAL